LNLLMVAAAAAHCAVFPWALPALRCAASVEQLMLGLGEATKGLAS